MFFFVNCEELILNWGVHRLYIEETLVYEFII